MSDSDDKDNGTGIEQELRSGTKEEPGLPAYTDHGNNGMPNTTTNIAIGPEQIAGKQ